MLQDCSALWRRLEATTENSVVAVAVSFILLMQWIVFLVAFFSSRPNLTGLFYLFIEFIWREELSLYQLLTTAGASSV